MISPRPTPFDLVFGPLAEDRFPPIQAALEADGRDPRDRDAFLMTREVVQFIRELRPEDAIGERIEQLIALLHHAYLFWLAGTPALELTAGELDVMLASAPGVTAPGVTAPGEAPPAFYVQLPERRVWAEVVPGAAHEPLDGLFLTLAPGGELRVLGAFGLRQDRMGLSVVEVTGSRPAHLLRPDRTALFASALPGGGAARLASLIGAEELLELGWRAHGFAAEKSR